VRSAVDCQPQLAVDLADRPVGPIPAILAGHLARPGGVNPEPPILLLDHDATGAFLLVVATGGIGARSGVDAARAHYVPHRV
jgi:hypothetical protein